jgi:hypothetical protein
VTHLLRQIGALFVVLGFGLLVHAQDPHHYPQVPHPTATPGDMCDEQDPDFHEYRYQERIPYCKRRVSPAFKKQIYQAYNIPAECRKKYTVDHLIPLSIGGSNDRTNLWPEHVLLKEERPLFEEEIYQELRDGIITQAQAIRLILEEKTRAVPLRPLKPEIDDPCDQPSQNKFSSVL